MTLVNFRNRPVSKNFNNVVDTFFTHFPSVFRDDFETGAFKQSAPVNVKQVENGFELEVIAPGFEKEAFKIALESNILTIAAEKAEADEDKAGKHTRREYTFQPFKRSFTLDENVDAENIDAKYANGVLKLHLPLKAEVKPATKQISIQ